MEARWVARIRWRRRGAWLWPAFVLSAIADGLIVHTLPDQGEKQSLVGGVLAGLVLNLLGVILLSRPIGYLLRRRRPDLPWVVARDYAGTLVILGVSAALALAGALHRGTVAAHNRSMQDAVARAQAWVGDRAPAEFRRNLAHVDAYAIQPGSIYRVCVTSDRRPRTYCVIVKTALPFARSVSFGGYEPNTAFAAGTD